MKLTTIQEGAIKHKKLFPKADLQSQIYKMEEELSELKEALAKDDKRQIIKELADVIIVCWGVHRFAPNVAEIFWGEACDTDYEIFKKAREQAEKKWAVNEGRTWQFNGKVYKHVGKDGEE